MTKTIGVAICALLLVACGGAKRMQKAPEASSDAAVLGVENLNEDFDPSQLTEPPFPIIPKSTEAAETGEQKAAPAAEGEKAEEDMIGYRIQIYQSENAQEAREFQREAILKLDVDCYLSYDNPYYKVRAGNFATRFEAEEFLARIEKRGYKSAWIVRTRIEQKPGAQPEEQPQQK